MREPFEHQPLLAFMAGSWVYGKPKPDSDVDVVIACTPEEACNIAKHADWARFPPAGVRTGYKNTTIRFGRLNLICVHTTEDYNAWLLATRSLKARGPMEKPQCIEFVEAVRAGVREL